MWSAIIAGVALVVAIFSVFFAAAQSRAAKEQAQAARGQLELADKARRESLEPYVVVDFEVPKENPWIIHMIIENIGSTPARDVKIDFEPTPYTTMDSETWRFSDIKILKEGIKFFPPGRRIEILFDNGREAIERKLEHRYRVTVNLNGPFGKVEPQVYDLDARLLDDVLFVSSRRTVHHVAEALQSIDKNFKSFLRRQRQIDT